MFRQPIQAPVQWKRLVHLTAIHFALAERSIRIEFRVRAAINGIGTILIDISS
jgi:hypothetical protein